MPRKGENIRKRKDGRWEGRYTVPSRDNNAAQVHSVYAKTYTEAKKRLIQAKQEVDSKKSQSNTCNILFADMADEWLENVHSTKKLSTYIKYRNIYVNYLREPMFGNCINDIENEDVQNHIYLYALRRHNTIALSESLERSIFCVISQIIEYTQGKYHIQLTKPCRKMGKMRNKPIQVFSIREQQILIDYLLQDIDTYKTAVYIS